MKIITNNQPRNIINGFELSEKERKKEFDYLSDEEIDQGSYIRYKNWVYSLDEFLRIENTQEFKGWHGYSSNSYFSGVLIKILDDDQVILGRYYC